MRWLFSVVFVAACGASPSPSPIAEPPERWQSPESTPEPAPTRVAEEPAPPECTGTLTVRFYDVGQALAVLVTLPDERTILIDAGEDPKRAGCGAPCREWHDHLLQSVERDVSGRLGMLWITHQHSDHVGGAEGLLRRFRPEFYIDNGRDLKAPAVDRARTLCRAWGVDTRVVEPSSPSLPFKDGEGLTMTPIVPAEWHQSCSHNPNNCSIGLRIDYCQSSVLFTGDAEQEQEEQLDPRGEVTLLQVAHHGSDTSSSPRFLARAKPKYAVISSGKPGVGTNRTYCHPRSSTVERLTTALGGAGAKTLRAFGGDSCRKAKPASWSDVPASDRLWATARDGDVVLATRGDGRFERVPVTPPQR